MEERGIVVEVIDIVPPILKKNVIVVKVDQLFKWAHANSIWPLSSGLACCAIEMMSCAAALVGMLPMALGGGLGSELRQSMGIGSVGGIFVSTLVSLYFIPALCACLKPRNR